MKKIILNPIGMLASGLFLGFLSRLADIYTSNIGNILSQMAIWILFGVLISIYSNSEKEAMLNVLLFCIGMLTTYYSVAFITGGVYSSVFIIGWTVFAFFSPFLAYFTHITRRSGVLPKIISLGIISFSLLSSIILFDGPRIYDFIIDGALAYFLFTKRKKDV
ncbi:MAG: hypothetical protein IKJ27_12055 [Clostridia bacterium]|nr:hypothetical protein [Clostridia bacterium]